MLVYSNDEVTLECIKWSGTCFLDEYVSPEVLNKILDPELSKEDFVKALEMNEMRKQGHETGVPACYLKETYKEQILKNTFHNERSGHIRSTASDYVSIPWKDNFSAVMNHGVDYKLEIRERLLERIMQRNIYENETEGMIDLINDEVCVYIDDIHVDFDFENGCFDLRIESNYYPQGTYYDFTFDRESGEVSLPYCYYLPCDSESDIESSISEYVTEQVQGMISEHNLGESRSYM